MRDDQREKRDRKTTRRINQKKREERKREREKEQGVSTSKVRPLLFHIAFI
jgi:hypothetical protein